MPAAKKTKTEDEPTAEEQTVDVAVPEVTEEGEPPVGPAVSEELVLSDDINDNDSLGTKTAEEVWPEGATPAGVPEDLPLYPRETVESTQTTGDVTWWHTSAGRWLTTKGVAAHATTVTHGPDEPPPSPDELRERNEAAAEFQAEMVAEGEAKIAEESAELAAEANEERKERNEELAAAQAEQQEKVDAELEEAVVALEVREAKEVREVKEKEEAKA